MGASKFGGILRITVKWLRHLAIALRTRTGMVSDSGRITGKPETDEN